MGCDLASGLFADGTSNYGGSWNGVPGSVTGLFYGDASQLVAQLVGVGTLIGFVFSFSYAMNWVLDMVLGHASRPRAKSADSIFRRWDSSATPSLSSLPRPNT